MMREMFVVNVHCYSFRLFLYRQGGLVVIIPEKVDCVSNDDVNVHTLNPEYNYDIFPSVPHLGTYFGILIR